MPTIVPESESPKITGEPSVVLDLDLAELNAEEFNNRIGAITEGMAAWEPIKFIVVDSDKFESPKLLLNSGTYGMKHTHMWEEAKEFYPGSRIVCAGRYLPSIKGFGDSSTSLNDSGDLPKEQSDAYYKETLAPILESAGFGV